MTRLNIQIAGRDDADAVHVLIQLLGMMNTSVSHAYDRAIPHTLAPSYTTGDTFGSSVCTVTREPSPFANRLRLIAQVAEAANKLPAGAPITVNPEQYDAITDWCDYRPFLPIDHPIYFHSHEIIVAAPQTPTPSNASNDSNAHPQETAP